MNRQKIADLVTNFQNDVLKEDPTARIYVWANVKIDKDDKKGHQFEGGHISVSEKVFLSRKLAIDTDKIITMESNSLKVIYDLPINKIKK
jgi:hypothetical protein